MSLSSNLYRLQLIDKQLDQANHRLQEIQAVLADQTAMIAVNNLAQAAEEGLLVQQKSLRQAETRVQDQKVKIQQTEAALYGGKVRNPKELQDLQSEAASLKRYLETLEDRQLDAMIAVEEAEAGFQKADQERTHTLSEVEQLHAGLRAEQDRIIHSIERLDIERQAAENAVPLADQETYRHLRKTRNGVAVAQITDRTCSACGSGLTPALIQAASVPNQLVRCQSCGRILYPG